MSLPTAAPEVTWAQRSSKDDKERNYVFLTIMAPDVPDNEMKLDVKPTSISFSGQSKTKKVNYQFELEFFAEIDPTQSKIHHTDRDIELVLQKKEMKQEYWLRLTKDSKKLHFLRTDFDKWVDEDEQDAVNEEDDYLNRMGGDGGFGGLDLSALGGGNVPGGAGADEESSEDTDEDMPALEGDAPETKDVPQEKAAPQATKIEEVE